VVGGQPASTYRLQIRSQFTLDDAAALADYLVDLGVDAVYLSPVLTAFAGSDHGYDVVDHSQIDPARGGEEGWDRFAKTMRSQGLKVLLDVVPNHVGVADAAQNHAWWELLRLGQACPYASWFDIDWPAGEGKVLIPILGDEFDPATDLRITDGELRYAEHRFPLTPQTVIDGASALEVHEQQHYRLVSYRLEQTAQNYRRFFAVTTLAAIRVEDPAVFAATHERLLRALHAGEAHGLRLDHPDGLADPAGYLRRLREEVPEAWLLVEKILEQGEGLPESWASDGTTGYDALTEVAGALVDPAAEEVFDALHRQLTGDVRDIEEHAMAGKREAVTTILRAEVARLARLVPGEPMGAEALAEILVQFSVYRSYLPDGVADLREALHRAREARPELALTFAALVPRLFDPTDELCVRLQQTSPAVMAKGVEDTAYYRYTRMIALNEVGGAPGRFGATLADFHQAQVLRQTRAARSMTTLSTHDTKRGEDVRARLYALSEFPDEWSVVVTRLFALVPLPEPSFAYLLWQTFIGVGFIERERMHAYVEKAMREAAVATNWASPDERFESVVHAAVDRAYDDPAVRALLQEFIDLVAPFGRTNSLSQKLIQLTMPGVPDVYQGTELWEDSLVDPDNRRPVDFDLRRRLLADLPSSNVEQLRAGASSSDRASEEPHGVTKLRVVASALRLRRERPDFFTSYSALPAEGDASDHMIAFDRGGAITLATRLPATLARRGGWGDTHMTLPYLCVDLLTGRSFSGSVQLADLMATLPVALLTRTQR